MGKATLVRVGAVAAAGAAVGLGVNALGSAGADTQTRSTDAARAHVGPALFGPGHARYARRPVVRALRHAVHAEVVVPYQGRFVTVTIDRGRVEKVEGSDLTLREGTRRLTYKTLTLTIPGDAVVRRGWQAAKLSDLQAGDQVVVIRGPDRTAVLAHRR